jgi:hypothetical protein
MIMASQASAVIRINRLVEEGVTMVPADAVMEWPPSLVPGVIPGKNIDGTRGDPFIQMVISSLTLDSGRTELAPCSKELNPGYHGKNQEYLGRIGCIANHDPCETFGTECRTQRHKSE